MYFAFKSVSRLYIKDNDTPERADDNRLDQKNYSRARVEIPGLQAQIWEIQEPDSARCIPD